MEKNPKCSGSGKKFKLSILQEFAIEDESVLVDEDGTLFCSLAGAVKSCENK